MKKRVLCILAALLTALLLGGCSMLDKEYVSIHDYIPSEQEVKTAGGRFTVSGADGLRQALLSLIYDGRSEGTIVFDSAYEGDPAAFSRDEVISSYPGIYATMVNRIARCESLKAEYEAELDANLGDEFTYTWRFNGEVYRLLANSGIRYVALQVGDDIAAFPNQAFYNNRLVEVPRPHQLASLLAQGEGKDALIDLLATRRIMFLASDVPLHSPMDKVNLVEADIIADIVARIYQMEKEKGFNPDTTVGVIVPYRDQIAAIRKALASHVGGDLQSPTPLTPHLSPLDITIDTVERYQGSQRKYIVYGFTVQKRYQLDFLTDNTFRDTDGTLIDRKLNVAMTRAEEHLILVGNPELLAQAPVFHQLITFLQDRQCLFNA